MAYRETLPRRGIARRQMMKRVARFSKLKGFDGGLPDSSMPGCERILYNVIGFQPPKTERCRARGRCCITTTPTKPSSP